MWNTVRFMIVASTLCFLGCQTGTIAVRESDEERATMLERAANPAREADLTVINLNVSHGFRCDNPPAPAKTATQCRLADRIDLLLDWIEARGCPDVVTLQEMIDRSAAFYKPSKQLLIRPLESSRWLLQERMRAFSSRCGFRYKALFDPTQRQDEELILSRYRIVARQRFDLHSVFGTTPGFFDRHVLYARIDHPIGPVDIFTLHLSSGSDNGKSSCDVHLKPFPKKPCPAACVEAGAATVRECQAVQVARLIERLHDVPTPAILSGDFNAEPGSFEYNYFIKRGYIDAFLAAGNPECDPVTSIGCTSGRPDTLEAMEDPTSAPVRRIEYIFVVPPPSGSACAGRIDTPLDADGDQTATRIFTNAPNPFASCGGPDRPICWVSDHNGLELDLNCMP